jgi:polyphenol oxidase
MATSSAGKKRAPRKTAPARANPSREAAPWNLRFSDGLQILEAPALAQLDWLVHGCSTRPGGASVLETLRGGRKATEQVLNLGFTEWDTRERVLANREKFFGALGASKMRFAGVRQIHSDMVHRADAPAAARAPAQIEEPPQGDALVTRDSGVLLVVQTADCIPVLLADTRQRAVAAIHAGWRGTVKRIVEKTLGRMQMEFGTRPEDVVAALGPGIGRCCYEVGSDVAKEFHAQFAEAREWFEGPFDALAAGENDPNWLPWLTMRPPGHAPPALRAHLDLIAANRAMLVRAGAAPDKISSSGYCTACRTDLFFSHRRERSTGRMMAAIGIR